MTGADPYCGHPIGGERCGTCGARRSCYPEPAEAVLDRDQARVYLQIYRDDPEGTEEYVLGLLESAVNCRGCGGQS